MPGFMPGIHVLGTRREEDVDGRNFWREDGASRLFPGHDRERSASIRFAPFARP